jgi:hypothetical protein
MRAIPGSLRSRLAPAPAAPAPRAVRTVWLLAAAVFLLAFCAFPWRADVLNVDLEGVFRAPDGASQGYTGERLFETLRVLDDAGRRLYAWSELLLDPLFVAAYLALAITVLRLAWPRRRASSPGARLARLLAFAVPATIAALDFVENGLLFHAARAPEWGSGAGDALLARLESLAWWAGPITRLKWKLAGLAALALLPIGLAASGRLGRTVRLLWLARVPLAGLGVLLAFAMLGGADRASPTIPNVLVQTSAGGLLLVAFLAGFTAILAGFSLTLVWELGGVRTDAEMPRLPELFRRWPDGSAVRGLFFLVFAVPLAFRSATRTVLEGYVSGAAATLAAVCGLLLAVAAVGVVEWAREQVSRRTPRAAGPLRRWLVEKLLVRLGPGYRDADGYLPGQGLALAGFLLASALYLAAWPLLAPDRAWPGSDALPTLAYVLGLVALVTSALTGATFYFDRWRVPLLAILALVTFAMASLQPARHEFRAAWRDEELPTVGEAAAARLARAAGEGGPRNLTVVTATGGGIQAAAWTATVLTELQRELGPRFPRSIALVSAVSGGSVGAWFYLSAMTDDGGVPTDRLAGVVAASEESSLEETAWGILYPDLQRAIHPFVSSLRDRAWAVERSWLAARAQHLRAPASPGAGAPAPETLAGWAARAAGGRLPAVVFNATRIDDGYPLLLSTVRSAREFSESPGLVPAYRYGYEPPRPGFLDLDVVTAARLSATFPYVTPIAQPRLASGREGFRPWRAADGGYFDNHGTTAALAWLRDLELELSDLGGVEKILWLQIDAFPDEKEGAVDPDAHLTVSSLGPIQGLVRVRTASQRVRRETELDLLKRRYGDRLLRLSVRPLAPTGPHREAPLSWHLGRRDALRIREAWGAIRGGESLAAVRDLFRGAPAATEAGAPAGGGPEPR